MSDIDAPISQAFLAGGGQMGALMRAKDWAATPLGPVGSWPQSLCSAVSIMLNSRYPIALYWGPHLALLYNDAWSPIPGGKHPWALGRPGREVWPEIWGTIGPLYERVFATGEGVWQEDELLPMNRHGYVEECYYNFTFSPVRGENGSIDGIFNAVVETTDRVLSERRLRTLSRMGERADAALSVDGACSWALDILADNAADVPFALLYLREGDTARLAAANGVLAGAAAAPPILPLDREAEATWPLAAAHASGAVMVVAPPADLVLPHAASSEPVAEVMLAPVMAAGEPQPFAYLVAGANPRRRIDAGYRSFFELAAGHVATAIATARAYAEERRRADALAELDRAKTQFFSNVSHEFRTPLTLMLGPLEDALAAGDIPADQRARLDVAHRNALRLLRLVNALLDFSRIEAGRVQASFRATDLAALTADLASSFRAATDKAGLALVVDAAALSQPVYVDPAMWETIVLNLMSNAFKYTLAGEIRAELRELGGRAVLTVRDTGTGIPASELPKLFDRFHRVEGAHGRSFEGSGIGLALVHELVRQHGGEIAVESAEGRGSTFTVTLPLGRAHLPADRIEADAGEVSTTGRTQSFVEEAMRWLPGETGGALLDADARNAPESTPEKVAAAGCRRVLLADDNADLRGYIARLLVERGYEVQAVADGDAALAAARAHRPDLLVTDVMMPGLDGLGLLQAVRDDPQLRDLPVIMLSARAGEEAKVDGLAAGADDYLTKPFSARELLARVASNLTLARVRREAAEAIGASEARVREVLEGMAEGFVLLDRDFRIVDINAEGLRLDMRPKSEIVGRCHWEVWPNAEASELGRRLKRVMAERTPSTIDSHYVRRDGRDTWFEVRAYPAGDGISIFYRDVSDRKRAEERLKELNETLERRVADAIAESERTQEALRQAQKMEAMGQLTGGVAHDFNNLLTPIVGSLDMLQRRQLGGEREQRLIAGAMHSAERAKTLVQRLLAFARRQPLQPVPVDVVRLVAGMAELVASTTGPQIRVVVDTPDGLPPARADPNQLEMALLNLSVNARDAMPDGGVLRISAGVERLREDRDGLKAGDYVRLSVADTGAGMDEATRRRAIEPFFSTKGVGKGTGLGLSMVDGLASQLGGALVLRSTPGLGTNVELWLPQSAAAVEADPPATDAPVPQVRGTALLVDDEEFVRLSTADMLGDLGFGVVEVASAEEALRLLGDGAGFDFVVTDHLMPGMTGAELARHVQAGRPGIPVLLVSGYAEEEGIDPTLPRLVKPFRKDELAAGLALLAPLPVDETRSGRRQGGGR